MQRCATPKHEVRDPADVVRQLVVIAVDEECIVVGAVSGEQGDDARHEEIEGGCALAGVDGEPDRRCQQQDIPERIGNRYALRKRREPRQVHVRGDEEDPGQQREADCENERVDQHGAVALRTAPLDEQEQPAEQDGIERQIDGVACRRESDRSAEQLRVRVRIRVPGDVEQLTREQESPRESRLRPVHADAESDRDHRGQSERVDRNGIALERRHENVERRQHHRRSEIPEPEAPAPIPKGGERHAATSASAGAWSRRAGCRSKLFASWPSTSTSCSISAVVFAAVT